MEFCRFADFADNLFFMLGDVNKRFMLVYLIIGLAGFLTMFALKAVALYTIAVREGYDNKWMAFVPFLNTYYIGVVSDKNKVIGLKTKTLGIITASIEFVYVAVYVLNFVAQFLIFEGGYSVPEMDYMGLGGNVIEYYTGSYTLKTLPQSLTWAGWIFLHGDIFIYVLDMMCLLTTLFLLMAFFQTYACNHYILFMLLSAIMPLAGIFMFAARNNRGRNYVEYIKERQYRQYQQYQEYMRMNGSSGNGGANPYNGGSFYGTPENRSDGDGGRPSAPKDPFED